MIARGSWIVVEPFSFFSFFFFLIHIGDFSCFSLGCGSAVDQQSKNKLSKASVGASMDSGKVESGMTE